MKESWFISDRDKQHPHCVGEILFYFSRDHKPLGVIKNSFENFTVIGG